MNADKCCHTVFSGNGNKNQIFFNLNIKNGLIPYNPEPTFLGIIFDEFLCFKDQVVMLRGRALKRLKIIKIFSNRSWQLDSNTLKCIYDALIGSIFTYSFFAIARIAKTWFVWEPFNNFRFFWIIMRNIFLFWLFYDTFINIYFRNQCLYEDCMLIKIKNSILTKCLLISII